MVNVAKLLNEQEILKSRINKMVYGSIEIREQNNKKYIYVHFCDNKKTKGAFVRLKFLNIIFWIDFGWCFTH